MYNLLRPLLFSLDAERAHWLTLRGADALHALGLARLLAPPVAPLPVRVFDLDFANPVGLAAGLDKNGEHVDALAALGFGFIEVGTVTPKPQPGNSRPRLFRLPAHDAIINRFGFNNDGVDALVANVDKARFTGPLGINIGKNKDTPNDDAVVDYTLCLQRVYARASYVTVNISSPNTQGLRDLQGEDALRRLINTLCDVRELLSVQHGARKPLLLKIAPDLDEAGLDAIADVLLASTIDGVIATNTTLDRNVVADDPLSGETGGLSGRPLRSRADAVLRGMARRLGEQMPLIGVGGIVEGVDATAKRDAGASLVQLYSGLVYRGPVLVRECVDAWRSTP